MKKLVVTCAVLLMFVAMSASDANAGVLYSWGYRTTYPTYVGSTYISMYPTHHVTTPVYRRPGLVTSHWVAPTYVSTVPVTSWYAPPRRVVHNVSYTTPYYLWP